jgi:N-acetylmuramoyl-L-alanine amidase
MATVVLDAGHGGYDNGASKGTRMEKNDTLKMVLAIGPILKNCGVNVIYTRSTDVFIPLTDRSTISNNAKANLFVSIHRNSSTNASANGAETFVYTSPSNAALKLAQNIQTRIAAVGVQGNRGVSKANYSVLRKTTAPAVLVELNFISNDKDNELFDSNFNAYANAIANGILADLGINCNGAGSSTGSGSGSTGTGSSGSGSSSSGTVATVSDIKAIQTALNSIYNANLSIDGIWGSASKKALLKALQLQLNADYGANLVADGIWGPKTKAAVHSLKTNNSGNLVWLLQAAMLLNGKAGTVAVDGAYGTATTAAVKKIQSAYGLTADGIAGPNTFEKLFK